MLFRDDKDFQSWDSGTQTLCGPYTADIQSLYSEYTGSADWRMPDFEENHENGCETGPYGSVRADIHTGWILQALGSLWDASWASKRHWKFPNPGFPCFSIFSYISYHPSTATCLHSREPEGPTFKGGSVQWT